MACGLSPCFTQVSPGFAQMTPGFGQREWDGIEAKRRPKTVRTTTIAKGWLCPCNSLCPCLVIENGRKLCFQKLMVRRQ